MKRSFWIKTSKSTFIISTQWKKANAISVSSCSVTRTLSKEWLRERRVEIWWFREKGLGRAAQTQPWSLQGRTKMPGQHQVTTDQRNLEINPSACLWQDITRSAFSFQGCVKQTPGNQHHFPSDMYFPGKHPSMPLPQVSQWKPYGTYLKRYSSVKIILILYSTAPLQVFCSLPRFLR